MAEVKRYRWEYGNFLAFVKKGKIQHAMIYAKALKIERKTLVHWMSQPELREAMISEIDEIVTKMKSAGKEDWRMWNELLKMLGVNDQVEVDHTSNGETMRAASIIDLGALKNEPTDQSEAGEDSGDDKESSS